MIVVSLLGVVVILSLFSQLSFGSMVTIYSMLFNPQRIPPSTTGHSSSGLPHIGKPVIYLYPQREMMVRVQVKPPDGFAFTYPDYGNGWQVTAFPGGKLINHADNQEYTYLYWEGLDDRDDVYDLSQGFVVAGEDTALFLQEKLALIGLLPKEYNEMIVYWLPKMQSHPYNLIHFATEEEYANRVPMDISPPPDSVLRVFMVYKPLIGRVEVQPQELTTFNRSGFTVVEWGGSELP